MKQKITAFILTSLALSASADILPAGAELTVDQAIVRSASARQHGNLDVSSRALKTVEKKAAKHAGFFTERAALALDRNDVAAALADCNRAIALDPRMSDAYDRRAYCLGMQGKLEQALKDYSMVIKLNPGSPKPWYNRALTYKKMGRLVEAGQDLKNFDKLSGKLRSRQDENQVIEAAQKQVQAGRLDTAIGGLEATNKQFPMAGYAYNLALLYRDKGDEKKALKSLDQAIELATKDNERVSILAFALADRGKLLTRRGKYADAEKDYTRLYELCRKGHPVNSIMALLKEYKKLALIERARVLKAQGKNDAAQADVKAAKALGASGSIDISVLTSAPEGGYEKAYEELSRQIKENPTITHLPRDRAFLSLQANRRDRALADFDRVLARDKEDIQALQGRGECRFFLEDYKNALSDFETITRIKPPPGESGRRAIQTAYTWRARCYGKLNARHSTNEPQAD